MKYVLAILVAFTTPFAAQAITIDLVTVGNPRQLCRNQRRAGIFGRVTTTYRIGITEVTNAQYVDFLNAKAATDTLGLYNSSMGAFNTRGGIIQSGSAGSFTYSVKPDVVGAGPGGADYTYGDKPVNFVSYYDALRFANWMTNGQGQAADTETGAYTLSGGTAIPSNASSIARTAGLPGFCRLKTNGIRPLTTIPPPLPTLTTRQVPTPHRTTISPPPTRATRRTSSMPIPEQQQRATWIT